MHANLCTILSAYKYGINVNLFLVINLLFELSLSLSLSVHLYAIQMVRCYFSFSGFFASIRSFSLSLFLSPFEFSRLHVLCCLLFFALLCIWPSCATLCTGLPWCMCVIQAYSIKCVLLTFVSSFTFQFWLLNSCLLCVCVSLSNSYSFPLFCSYFHPHSVCFDFKPSSHFFSSLFPLILIQRNCRVIYGVVFSSHSHRVLNIHVCMKCSINVYICVYTLVSRNLLRLLKISPKLFCLSIALACLAAQLEVSAFVLNLRHFVHLFLSAVYK